MRPTTKTRGCWRIGELAKAAGLTVRAVHHYEQIGLLAVPGRNDGGHRCYDRAALERLYVIRALRDLGLSLAEIRHTLERSLPLKDLLRAQLSRIDEQVRHATYLRDKLEALTSHPEAEIAIEDLLEALGAMRRIEGHIARHRREGSPLEKGYDAKWRALGKRLRACLDAGEEPDSERALRWAAEAQSLIDDFSRGDPTIVAALADLRIASPPKNLAGWDPPLMRFLHLSLESLGKDRL